MTNEIDARGLLCPLPVLKARKVLNSLREGDVIALHADDPMAVVDIPHFCSQTRHELVEIKESSQGNIFILRSGGAED